MSHYEHHHEHEHVHDHEHAHDHDHAHEHLSYMSPGVEPAVFAAQADVVFTTPLQPTTADSLIERFLSRVAEDLSAAHCLLVGHIKGTLVTPSGDALGLHLTSLDGHPRIDGGLGSAAREATFTVNVIVFGVAESALPHLVTEAWEAASGAHATTTWRN